MRNLIARRAEPVDAEPAGGAGKAFDFATAVVAAAVFVFAPQAPARAAGLTLECARADVFNPMWDAAVAFAFEGDEHGTLSVDGVFGSFAIPVWRRPLEVKSGGTTDTINGAAPAHVKLAALSDIEACIDRIPGAMSAAAQSDAFLDARDQCMRELPAAAAGVDVTAQISLGVYGEPGVDEDAYVLFKLIYAEPSRAPGGEMVVEAFPSQCTLRK